ncbi:MAG TPA: M23 family metallopeptidase [Bacteroidales bacterium]|nr:M23 family metallopeptidase [Bacteroidales bacterium]
MDNERRIKRRKLLMKRLKHKYRLVFFNDNTFEEVWHLRLSLYNVLSVAGTISILLVLFVIVLMAFTPLRELIPGYPDESMRASIFKSALRLDSLQEELRKRDQYFLNLNALISGKEPMQFEAQSDTSKNVKNVKFTKSVHDSLLRQRIEEEEKFNFSVATSNSSESDISKMHFFSPVKGIVTDHYDAKQNHLGIDIVASPNEVVKATLDGTVILATWTLETGYIIQLQHQGNIISVYKHNANLLKKVGAQVRSGDPIAILGNSGELTTGPHLHFELWYNGKPVNPEDYLIFN